MIRIRPPFTKWTSFNLLCRAANISGSSVSEVKPDDREASSSNVAVNSKAEGVVDIRKSKLVAQVFANLNTPSEGKLALSTLEEKVKKAKNVEELLVLAGHPKVTRKLSLSILSTLGDWTTEKKIKLSDFESDSRFVNMCRLLSNGNASSTGLGDLATVLGVTGDDEAAKLISSASISQMVRILSKLSTTKKRSPPLLRSLAFNLSKSEENLSVKQCADVLFAMVNLSFHDEVLLVKICADACTAISESTKSSVVGSIARSLGMLRCRDAPVLDRLSEWVIRSASAARPQDIVAVIMAMALVDYHPTNEDNLWQVAVPMLRPLDLPNSSFYLDAVWSLVLLDKVTYEQVACVLSAPFIEKLRNEDGGVLSVSTTLKLLNISATSQNLLRNYKGPTLDRRIGAEVPLGRSKDKTTLVNCVMDTLANLLPGENFLRRDVDTQAGFLIDGECLVDQTCTPLPVTSGRGKAGSRVAVMVLGYHDTCVGARFRPNGVHSWIRRLLEARGFKVLHVLHSEFSPASKLVQRVQYLETKLKALVTL